MNTSSKLRIRESQKPDLDRKEWDFRPGPDLTKETKTGNWAAGIKFDFLPENETAYCWLYEFCRYDTRDAEGFLKWRTGAGKPTDFDSLLDHYWRTDPNGKAGISLVSDWFYMIWPEWPEKPYLSVPAKDRQARFKKTWAKNPKGHIRLIPLRDIYRSVVAWKAGGEPDLPLGRSLQQMKMEVDTWIIPSSAGANQEKMPPIEIAAFEIDFAITNEILAARFQNWLEQRRKEKGYKRLDKRWSRTNRGDLIALGAMRLMDSGISIVKATEYSRKISGKALYEDAGDWSNARRRAEDAIYRAC